MDILNNQFIIHQLMSQNHTMRQYMVTDLQENHQRLLLQTFRPDMLPKDLMDYYKEHFLHLTQVANKYVLKNYHFNSIRTQDNRMEQEDWYFYTTEYIDESTPLLAYVKGMSLKQKMDVFIDICRGIHYLHVKDIVYSAIHPENVLIVNGEVKWKDLATIAMEKFYQCGSLDINDYYQSTEVLSGEVESCQSDVYSMAVLLLTIILEEEITEDPYEYVQAIYSSEVLKKRYGQQMTIVTELFNLIKQILRPSEGKEISSIIEITRPLYRLFSFSRPFIEKDALNKLYDRFRLAGRQEEIMSIMANYNKMLSFKPSKKIFYVQGNNGVGKTRFLEELKFLFELQKGKVYASIDSRERGMTPREMWLQLLNELLHQSEVTLDDSYLEQVKGILSEIREEMQSATPFAMWDQWKSRSKILHAIVRYLGRASESQPIILMLDDLDQASQFTLDILFQLCIDLANQSNVTIILSGPDDANMHHANAIEFMQRIKQLDITEAIPLEPLNEQMSTLMIKQMFALQSTPNVGKQVYDQSYGNAQFIFEIMKDLYIREIIYIDEDTGEWSINLPEKSNYSSLKIPENVEQAMVNRLEKVDEVGKELLRKLAIFNEPITMAELQSICHLDEEKGKDVLKQLLHNQFIVEIQYDNELLYDFQNQTLKNIIYNKIPITDRNCWHETATNYFIKVIDDRNPADLEKIIFHASQIGHKEILMKMHRKLAEVMSEKRHTKEQIKHLKKIYDLMDNPLERAKLLLEIGNLFADIGNPVDAIRSFEEAEQPILQTKDVGYAVDIYLNLANVHAFNLDAVHTNYYLDKVAKYIQQIEKPCQHILLECKRIKAIAKIGEGNYEASKVLLREVIEEAGASYLRIKGDALRTLAYIYIVTNRSEEALVLLEEAVTILEKENYPRGILLALNNIGVIYSYKEPKRAIRYFERVRDLSEAYGNTISEIYALGNMSALYSQVYRLEEAYRYAQNGLRLAEQHNITDRIYFAYSMLIPVYIRMNQYEKALHYYERLKAGSEQGIPGLFTSHYHLLSVDLWTELGMFTEADKYRQRILKEQVNKDETHESIMLLHEQMKAIVAIDPMDKQALQIAIDDYKALVEIVVDLETLTKTSKQVIEDLLEKDLMEEAVLIHEVLTERLGNDIAIHIQAKKYYIDSLFEEGKKREKLLRQSIDCAKQMDNKTLLAQVNGKLGKYFEDHAELYDAITFYLESWYNTRKQLQAIPIEYHLPYVKGNDLLLVYERLEKLYNHLFAKSFPLPMTNMTNLEAEQLKNILQVDVMELFTQEPAYITHKHERAIQGQQVQLRSMTDVVNHMSGHSLSDLKMVLQYTAAITDADHVMIITENEAKALEVTASNDNNNQVPTHTYLFQRVRKTLEPALISDHISSRYDHIIGKDKATFSALICVPIVKRATTDEAYSVNHFLGYLYLETSKMVNHFDVKHLHRCVLIANFLTLLLEKVQLEKAASTDKLTGTLTRKYIEDRLEDVTTASYQNDKKFSIVMFDLDHFKQINDQYGHLMGDRVLAEVCRIARGELTENDAIGRFGGEEFLMILPERKAEEAFEIVEGIRKQIKQIRPLAEDEQITISSGIASYPLHGMSPTKLLERVDQALYVAKESGRNQTVIWEEEYMHRTDAMDKLSGLVLGDSVTDYRNVSALIELVQLTNDNEPFENKVTEFLHRVMELIEADYSHLLMIDDGEITANLEHRVLADPSFDHQSILDKDMMEQVIQTKRSMYRVTWGERDREANDLHAGLCTPIVQDDKVLALLYFGAKANKKIFNFKDSNAVNVYKEIMLNILRQQ